MNRYELETGLLIVSLLLLALLGNTLLREVLPDKSFFRRRNRHKNGGGEVDEDLTPLTGKSLLRRRLNSAGLRHINPLLFIVFLGLLGVVAGLGLMELFRGMWPPVIIGFGLTVYTGYAILREVGRNRALKFEERLVDTTGFMAGAFQAGQNPIKALSSAAEASHRQVRRELNEVVQRLNLGFPIRRSLAPLVDRYDSEGVRMFVNALAAKWQAGGDMAPMMREISVVMRDRLQHRLRLKSQLGGAQLTSLAAGLIPYLLLLFFVWVSPDWLNVLLNHPWGPSLLFTTICLQIIGFLWLQRITKIEF